MDKGAFPVGQPPIGRLQTLSRCRKSRALVGLGRLEEARQALVDGLQFEPNDKVCASTLARHLLTACSPGAQCILQRDRRQAEGGRRQLVPKITIRDCRLAALLDRSIAIFCDTNADPPETP